MRWRNWVRGLLVVGFTLAALMALCLWPYRDALIKHAQRKWYMTNCQMQFVLVAAADAPYRLPSYLDPELEGGYPTDVRDEWGNAIRLKPHPKGLPWFRVVSLGPNGVDEDGQGDDIAYAVDTSWGESPFVFPGPPPDTALMATVRKTPTWLAVTALLAYPFIALIRSPGRLRRDASVASLWGSAILAAAAGVACIVSVVHPVGGSPGVWVPRETNYLSLAHGSLGFEHKSARLCRLDCIHADASTAESLVIPESSTMGRMYRLGGLTVRQTDIGGYDIIRLQCRLPLWLVFLVFAPWAPLAWLRGSHRRARRRARGLCEQCAYNLTGNVSGVCPECGTPIAAKPSQTRPDAGDSERTA